MGLLVLAVIGSFVLLNGILMIWDPRLWGRLANRLYDFTSGGNSWFRYRVEEWNSEVQLLQWRIGGVMVALCGIFFLSGVVRGTIALIRGVAARKLIEGHTAAVNPLDSYIGFAFLTGAAIFGSSLLVAPQWTLRWAGMSKWLDMPTRLAWVWRVIGGALVVSWIRALFL